jgi:hypothetical protein
MSKSARVFVESPDTHSERVYPLSLTVIELKVGATSSMILVPHIQKHPKSASWYLSQAYQLILNC